jgi:hypothetical protein
VAESGAGESFGQILQNWSNVGNLFVAFIIAGLVPVLKYISRKYTGWKDKKDAEQAAKEKEAIIDIAKEVQQPLTERISKVEEVSEKLSKQNDMMLDHLNIIEQLLQGGRISFQRGPGRPPSSKHFDHSSGMGDHSDYHPK